MMPRMFVYLFVLVAGNASAQWDFGNAFPIGFAETPLSKNLAVDSDGNIHAAFRSGAFVRYHLRQESNGEWQMPVAVNDSLSMGAIGEISIAWNPLAEQPIVAYQANERIWFAARQTGGAWIRTMLGDSAEDAYSPDVAVNSSGVIYVVYVASNGGDYQLEYGQYNGAVWQFDDIDTDIGDFGLGASPRIAVDENDAGHVVFRGGNFGSYNAKHATNEQGENWVVTTLFVPHAESYPGDIAVDGQGIVHCVSSGSEGFGIPRPVYYHYRSLRGEWSFGTAATGNEYAGEPVIALAGFGYQYVMSLGISGNFYTGELLYSSSATGWEPEVIYGSADGPVAFAIDWSNYGHLFVPSSNGTIYYLESVEPLFDPGWGPEISIEPDTLDFGDAPIGEVTTRQIRFENPNEALLRITGFILNSQVFHGPDEWHTIELWWGQSTTIDVRFEPTTEDTYSAIGVVISNALTSPDTVFITGRGDVGAETDHTSLPNEFTLYPLYPNPFNGSVNVEFELPRETIVTLDVFDVLGRRVETLLSGSMSAGSHVMQWNAQNNATGVYLFKLDAGGQTVVQKAAFLK